MGTCGEEESGGCDWGDSETATAGGENGAVALFRGRGGSENVCGGGSRNYGKGIDNVVIMCYNMVREFF